MLVVLLYAAPANARQGLYIGGSLFYTSIGSDTHDAFDKAYFDSLDSGPGIGLRLGWGLNDYFALEGSLSRSYHKTNFLGLANTEDQVLEGQSLVLKINVPLPDSKLEPYVFVGGGRYNIGDSNGPYYRGSSIEYGIGMDLYLTRAVSLNAGLSRKDIRFNKGKFYLDNVIDVETTTVDIGIAYHFR